MADEHFWDNGVSSISTEENCKLVFETIDGQNKTTPLMTIDKTLKLMDALKNGRQTVSCEAIKVSDGEEQTIQAFKLNVIEVDGKKIII
ncbi:MAG: hypothetical protein Q4E51_06450 [Lachnospiraceae bacterium]|nr:hypothetical protein [Lachnospiraceae bacterium]